MFSVSIIQYQSCDVIKGYTRTPERRDNDLSTWSCLTTGLLFLETQTHIWDTKMCWPHWLSLKKHRSGTLGIWVSFLPLCWRRVGHHKILKCPCSPCTSENLFHVRSFPVCLELTCLQTNQFVVQLWGFSMVPSSEARRHSCWTGSQLSCAQYAGVQWDVFGPGLFQKQTTAAAKKSALAAYWTIWEPSGVSLRDILGLQRITIPSILWTSVRIHRKEAGGWAPVCTRG